MTSITSANAIFTIAIANLFPAPRRIERFSAEDMFTGEAFATAEVSMGVDGFLSAGFIYVPYVMSIMLQADSPSNQIFDRWAAQQQRARDTYVANGVIRLQSVGKKYNLIRGFLTSYKPIPDARRVLQPRTHQITWAMPIPVAL